jgi:hypothetical protein
VSVGNKLSDGVKDLVSSLALRRFVVVAVFGNQCRDGSAVFVFGEEDFLVR